MGNANVDIRGELLIVLQRFAESTFDDATRTAIRAGLSPQTSELLQRAKPAEYYPTKCATELLHGIDVACGDPQKSFDTIKRFGEYLATDAMRSYMKLLFKILTPGLLTTKFPAFYQRYYRNGELIADASRISEKKVFFRSVGHDYLHALATGRIFFVYGELGMKNLRVTTNVPLGAANVPGEITWEVTWD